MIVVEVGLDNVLAIKQRDGETKKKLNMDSYSSVKENKDQLDPTTV